MRLSQRLRDRLWAQRWPRQVDHLLQHPTTALGPGRANSGGSLWEDRRFVTWGACPSCDDDEIGGMSSEEHTSELQSLMRNSYAVFCLQHKKLGPHQLKTDASNHHEQLKPHQHP